jgi:hypothetical protein
MEAYVYHFAGSGDRFIVLPRISWNQPPEPWQGLHQLDFPARQLRCPEEVYLKEGVLHYRQKETPENNAQLICYGPYFSMEPGNWEITLDAEGKAGLKATLLRQHVFQLSFTSRYGGNTHARFLIPGKFSPTRRCLFQFALNEHAPYFEFVIRAFLALREFILKSIRLRKI